MAPNEKSRLSPGHGLRNLTHENSSSIWRRSKSTANMREQAAQGPSASSTSLKPAPKLERTPSKMSLFNLFSKPKVEKARGHTEVGMAVPMPPQQEQYKPLPSPPKSSLRQNPPPHTQQVQRMRTSQIFNPISIRSSSMERPTSMIEDEWQPLPLFQAYQQGIKHATVQACAFSPDVLLRTQSQRRQAELLRERAGSRPDLDNIPEQKKLEKPNRRLMTNPISGATPQLTNKVYVLIPSGYIMQYAAEGTFDRLPEKVLKLGHESAAFACDLIPGKHWVLQISQSANEDGIVTTAPRHSIFSRLRLQGSSARKTATSFLLVLESAEEMESWMTTVRREIENLGGMKIADDSSRASSSTDIVSEKMSTDTSYSQHPAERESKRTSRANPVDSPLQSQYSDSPKIIMSEWEGDRIDKRSSVADSVSVRSRYSIGRRSVEAPSITTTVASQDQMQLDQLRHSRHSYISASASAAGTIDTSRDSSPASTSPRKEGFSHADAEPLRSATSLKSFHMSANRRRSMQPLPVTNEDTSLSAATDATPQRHSAHSSNSPVEDGSVANVSVSAPPPPSIFGTTTTRPAGTARYSSIPAGRPYNPPNLIRYSTRSSSAPPSRISTTATPPPKEPAPTPPSAARPQSTLGSPPNHSERRISATPKPYIRPFPVRPQSQTNKDGSVVVPRRFSSLGNSGPAPLPLGIVINRSATSPLQPSTSAMNSRSQPGSNNALQNQQSMQQAGQQLRRPNSVQIRSSTAPFLSQSRPTRVISSTPSFVPSKRTSAAPTGLTSPVTPTLYSTPSVPVLRGQGQQLSPPKSITPRRSVPNMLPPPAPPPNMPLPLLPVPPPGEPQRAVPV
ncbi:hypothetical protein DM02DRAFT_212419 [Periconia macrospinosa]|uniref:PH domain-containing protein n=1 Tax=Periconia macrospinosa TaxID=97972 RepID=A0A2V1D6Y3_9PLEO|nr:hypothetical protein DM02DRAFT_212419 [Periconia macrospinosa]